MQRFIYYIFILILSIPPNLADAQIIAEIERKASECKGGKVTIKVENAAKGFNFEYAVNGAYQGSNVFDNLPKGEYTASVRDMNSKCSFSTQFKMEQYDPLSFEFSGIPLILPDPYCADIGAHHGYLVCPNLWRGGAGGYEFTPPCVSFVGAGSFTITMKDRAGCKLTKSGSITEVGIKCAIDPNDIHGPEGYGSDKMIAKSKSYSYSILFENDPEFASVPAQAIRIEQAIDTNAKLSSLRLEDFGFGGQTFQIPPGRTFYSTRLDLMNSLGVVVDVTAGIDVVRHQVFWTFESKDPNTGLPPANVFSGFLPVNDSSGKGQGFVNYSIKAADKTQTGDSIHAQANIIFDANAPIATPRI